MRILVIRTGALFDEDPIEELQRVLEDHSECGFGKMGKPLGRSLISKLFNSSGQYLAISKHRRGREAMLIFPVLRVEITPACSAPTPAYYAPKRKFISSWVVVSKPKAKIEIEARDLALCSSGRSLPEVLANSMAGHFLVRPRNEDVERLLLPAHCERM